jgi:hypothetical protein
MVPISRSMKGCESGTYGTVLAAEYLTVAYFRARGIPAEINDAPEEDREGGASHDIVVAGELWDVKTDFIAAATKRIFVERASLEHTQSQPLLLLDSNTVRHGNAGVHS